MQFALEKVNPRKKPGEAYLALVGDLSRCEAPKDVKRVCLLWQDARLKIREAAKWAKKPKDGSNSKSDNFLRMLRNARNYIEEKAEEFGTDISDFDIGGPRKKNG